MNDDELFQALKLSDAEAPDLWRKVQPRLDSRASLWEFLTPVAAAIVALAIAHLATSHPAHQSPTWPVHELVVPATITQQGP